MSYAEMGVGGVATNEEKRNHPLRFNEINKSAFNAHPICDLLEPILQSNRSFLVRAESISISFCAVYAFIFNLCADL